LTATAYAKGLLSWIPGIHRAFVAANFAGGTESAKYCYGVWLKHLTLLRAHGMATVPETVLELGPGASIGTGVAALLSGARNYLAVDVVRHLRENRDLALFHELAGLFRARAPRPRAGFPAYDQYLDARLFPSHILDEPRLAEALDPERLDRLEADIARLSQAGPESAIRYFAGDDAGEVPERAGDLVFSQVVLNHANELEPIYADCARWLKPGGWMSHQVDFTANGTAAEWNGHLAYGELAWKIVLGRRPYFINRAPVAEHLRLLDAHGFDLVHVIRARGEGGIRRDELARRWRTMSDDDFTTRNAFIIARKR
jgi:SAM-dependent methyltransferase